MLCIIIILVCSKHAVSTSAFTQDTLLQRDRECKFSRKHFEAQGIEERLVVFRGGGGCEMKCGGIVAMWGNCALCTNLL